MCLDFKTRDMHTSTFTEMFMTFFNQQRPSYTPPLPLPFPTSTPFMHPCPALLKGEASPSIYADWVNGLGKFG